MAELPELLAAQKQSDSGRVPPSKIKKMLHLSDELTKITRAI